MESGSNVRADREVDAGIVSVDANALKDRDINSITSEQDKTPTKSVTDVIFCSSTVDRAETESEFSFAESDGGVRLYDDSMDHTVELLANALETELKLADDEGEEASICDAKEAKDVQAEKSPIVDTGAVSGADDKSDESVTRSESDGDTDKTPQAIHEPQPSPTLGAQPDDTKSEPFPDYYESCENNPQIIDKEHEAAYNYAISKVVEEVIRFREVDSSITELPPLDVLTPRVTEYLNSLAEFEASTSEPNTSTATWEPSTETQLRKITTLQDITVLLERNDLKETTRQRFTALTNLIIRMEFLLFRQNGPGPNQDELTLNDADLWELNTMTKEMIKFLSTVENQLQSLVEDCVRVAYILCEVKGEPYVTAWTKYKQMSRVATK